MKKYDLLNITLMFILRILPLSISLFFLITLTYFDKHIYNGYRFIYYEKYYFIFIFLTIFFTIFFFIIKSKDALIKSYIVFFSLFLSLFFVEIALNYIKLEKNVFEQSFKIPRDEKFDTRDKYSYYLDRKKDIDNIIVAVPTDHYIGLNHKFLPLAGKSMSQSILCNETGTYIEYFSDRYGFNNLDKNWDRNNKILLIGDSYTHGACVENKFTIAGRVNNKFNVLNLGYISSGPMIEYARFKEYYKKANTPYVIWIFSEQNDLDDLRFESTNNILQKYYYDENFHQNILQKQSNVDRYIMDIFYKKLDKEKNIRNNKLKKTDIYEKTNNSNNKLETNIKLKKNNLKFNNIRNRIIDRYPNHERYFFKIIKKVEKLLINNNSKLIFVYMPSFESYAYDDPFLKRRRYVISEIKKANINLINITDIFNEYHDVLSLYPFRSYGHPNAKGYELVANEIIKKVTELEKY